MLIVHARLASRPLFSIKSSTIGWGLGLFCVAFLFLRLPLSGSSSFSLSFFSLLTKASHVRASEGKVFVEVWNFHALFFPSVVSNLAGEYLFYVRGINDVCRQRANSKGTHIMYELKPLGSAHPARVRRSAYLQDARVRDTGGVDTLHAITLCVLRFA